MLPGLGEGLGLADSDGEQERTGTPSEAARDAGRRRADLDLNDTHLGNPESRELGSAWEGTAGHGTLSAPEPIAPSWRCVLGSALGKQGAERERQREGAPAGLHWRTEVAQGERCKRKKRPGN